MFDAEVSRAVAHWGPHYGVKIPTSLVHAIIEQESRHGRDPGYVRQGGAVLEPDGDHSYGLMMVKGATATSVLGLSDPRVLLEPAVGIWYGTAYLARLLKRFGGDATKAISAYNAGPGNVGVNPGYVAKVKGFLKQYGGAGSAVGLALAAAVLFLLARRRRRAA